MYSVILDVSHVTGIPFFAGEVCLVRQGHDHLPFFSDRKVRAAPLVRSCRRSLLLSFLPLLAGQEPSSSSMSSLSFLGLGTLRMGTLGSLADGAWPASSSGAG